MKKSIGIFFSIFLFFSLALPAFADFKPLKDSDCLQPVNDSAGVLIENAITIGCIPIIVGNVVYWLIILAGIAALILIIISGFKFVTSGGDPKQAEGARKTLTWAIIGLIVVLLSFGIISFISQVTGVDKKCLTRFGFTQCVPDDLRSACSARNPNGWCDNEEKECLPIKERPTIFSCQYRCGDLDHDGWCAGGKTCKRFDHQGDVTWTCQL